VIFAAFFFRPASLQILAVAELRLRFAPCRPKNKFVNISPPMAGRGITGALWTFVPFSFHFSPQLPMADLPNFYVALRLLCIE
jgi:hypothetical protein